MKDAMGPARIMNMFDELSKGESLVAWQGRRGTPTLALLFGHWVIKSLLTLALSLTFASSLRAQVEVLPPDFELFGKSSGDYAAEWFEYIYPLSTNGDYLLPHAGPLNDERVYFLQRVVAYVPRPGIQTYYVPDDVYVCFPIVIYEWDNIYTFPLLTVEELRDGVRSFVDDITGVSATVDGQVFTNLLGYRSQTPVFSVNFPSSDNIYTFILDHPLEGLVDPMVGDGYLLMLKPLSPGLHDFRTGYTIGAPDGFSIERHFQVYSLTLAERLAKETEQLTAMVAESSLPSTRKQPLLVTLNAAKASFTSGELLTAANQLHAFQNKVRVQVAPSDQSFAEQLTDAAQKIIAKATAQLNTPASN